MYRSEDARTSHHGLFPPSLRFLGLEVKQVHSLGSIIHRILAEIYLLS